MSTNITPLVLIIEDSPTQAEKFAAELTRHGAQVVIAHDGPEGLKAAHDCQPQVIVLDVVLPSMDGYQVCRRLKRDTDTSHIPVVMLTISEGFEAVAQGLEAGVSDL
jgi:PleD family two-component response regulator